MGKRSGSLSRIAVHVFHFNSDANDWVENEVKNPLENEAVYDKTNDIYVDFSPIGRTMAVSRVSATLSEFVQVYELNDERSQWIPVGQAIESSAAEEHKSPSVFLSYNRELSVGFLKCVLKAD